MKQFKTIFLSLSLLLLSSTSTYSQMLKPSPINAGAPLNQKPQVFYNVLPPSQAESTSNTTHTNTETQGKDNYEQLSRIEKMFYNQALELIEKANEQKQDRFEKLSNFEYNKQKEKEEIDALESENKQTLKKRKDFYPELMTKQYGYDIFHSQDPANQAFSFPVDRDYILGPGDTLELRIWGKMESTLALTVDEKGKVFLSKVGFVTVSGYSLEEARDILSLELNKHFVNINISLTVNKARSIPVFILGHAKKPGAYQLSSLASLMHALYLSGGPSKDGSLRHIELRRKNGPTITVDLYDYILNGDAKQDPKLKENDVIYIPSIGDVIKVKGGIKTSAIFEIKQNDKLHDVIFNYASGLSANSEFDLINIERNEKGQRKIITIDTQTSSLKNIAVKHGDTINVPFANLDIIKGVQIQGHVHSPGYYNFKEGLRLDELIKKADNFKDNAYLNKIKLSRLTDEHIRQVQYINYHKAADTVLQEQDIITVLNGIDFGVTITGIVKLSGTYNASKSSTLADIIKLADGFKENADLSNIHISRLTDTVTREDIFIDFNTNPDFLVKPEDKIIVRFKESHITLEGAVKKAQQYSINTSTSLSDIIKRASGFSEEAYVKTIHISRLQDDLTRTNLFVNYLNTPEFKLSAYDIITVPLATDYLGEQSLSIQGEVYRPNNYKYDNASTLKDILLLAGIKESSELNNIEIYRKLYDTHQTKAKEEFIIVDARLIFETGKNNVHLFPNDVIYVKKKAGSDVRKISISGEVLYPGTYYFKETEKLSTIIQRAGGFTEQAFIDGIRYNQPSIQKNLKRQLAIIKMNEEKKQIYEPALLKAAKSTPINQASQLSEIDSIKQQYINEELKQIDTRIVINFNDQSEYDSIQAKNGDELHVPKIPDYIHVIGGVINNGNIKFKQNKKIKYYISKSGGFTKYSVKKQLFIIRANGEIDSNSSKVKLGDTIYVPEEIKRPFHLSDFLAKLFDTIFKTASVISVINTI